MKYECNQCDHRASRKGDLTTHIQSVHEGVKYDCNQCDYKAAQQGSLTHHIQSVHEGVKYDCYQCDYRANYIVIKKIIKIWKMGLYLGVIRSVKGRYF